MTQAIGKNSVSENGRDFWCNTLLFAAGAAIVLSIGMAVPPYLGVGYFNFLFFGAPSFPAAMTAEGVRYATFLYGLIGCITIGWMILVGYLAHGPIRQGDEAARKALLLAVAIWFVIDSAASIALGFWQNAVSNLSLAALFIVPLMMLRPKKV